MDIIFHPTTRKFLFHTGKCSGAPDGQDEQLANNKADYKSTHDLTDEQYNSIIRVVLDDRDPANKPFFAVMKTHVPTISDDAVVDEEKEYDEVETGEVTKELELTKAGKIKKDSKGEYVFKEIKAVKLVPKAPYNRNRSLLLPVEDWEENERRKALATKKERIKALHQKIFLSEASSEEIAEYKTLKNIN